MGQFVSLNTSLEANLNRCFWRASFFLQSNFIFFKGFNEYSGCYEVYVLGIEQTSTNKND